jgi:2-polyprenyl-3-methyl-5-hydroxy-6-metoxy-1,4-benzoquinol methylase
MRAREHEHHERLWQAIPEGQQPADLLLRSRFLLEHVSAGQRVLDVGCGEGFFAELLAGAGAHVLGVDVAEEPLRRARLRRPELELARVPADGPWPLPDAHFDVVWAGEVIEHVAHTGAWLSELRRVLRSGGKLLLSTPANAPLSLLRCALSPRAFAARFDPRGEHLRFYTRATLTALVEDFRFSDVRVRSAGGPPGARRVLLLRAVRARF